MLLLCLPQAANGGKNALCIAVGKATMFPNSRGKFSTAAYLLKGEKKHVCLTQFPSSDTLGVINIF